MHLASINCFLHSFKKYNPINVKDASLIRVSTPSIPVCEEMCAYGEEHQKECQIFSKVEPQLKVEDFSTPSPIYWCITAIRLLVLRESDPIKYGIVTRMMDHNEEHAAKKSNWKLYKENVVDFLRYSLIF